MVGKEESESIAKKSNSEDESNYAGDTDVTDKERLARESHCEIERRRRSKMATYVNELCDMVPACSTLARKPDKLTILRLAVAHMKTLQGTGNTSSDGSYKPSFLTDQELKHLILEAADGFLFVVQCETGRIIYVSDSILPVLNHSQQNWYSASSIFDMVHPDDVQKLREQLSTSESQNVGRILDLKTGTLKKEGHQSSMRLCMSSRRGFICRMKVGNVPIDPLTANHTVRLRQMNTLGQSSDGQQYAIVHVTGYLKNWPLSGVHVERNSSQDDELQTSCCLVGIGRLQVTSTPNVSDISSGNASTYISRHSVDGKITFVDQRVTAVLGYQPQELLDKHVQDLCHPEEEVQVKESFDHVLKLKGQMMSLAYRLRNKSGEWTWIKSCSFSFLNPYTDQVEYIVSTNTASTQSNANDASEVQNTVDTDLYARAMSQGQYPLQQMQHSLVKQSGSWASAMQSSYQPNPNNWQWNSGQQTSGTEGQQSTGQNNSNNNHEVNDVMSMLEPGEYDLSAFTNM
ncbi:DgyrCDS2110 [Dimorphilus gyrociliatus]|uniref:DgyrCDS2110 n=1 Tax=Dimorphilus gyrociliatus TaxID=2664684 RepID=A0A7I8VC31_9ANNE|nr:DgyrCDS2110 [Dimorphilus gyrociliatus]